MKRIIFVLSTVFLIFQLISCRRELITDGVKDRKISQAKEWFLANYSNAEGYNEEFVNIEFDWAKAKVAKYGDDYTPIVIPIKNTTIKSNYLGLSSLIVFPAKNGSFFHRVFTAFPDVSYLKSHKGKINRNDFTGIASFWDLKLGFVRAAYSTQGQLISPMKIISPISTSNTTSTTPPPVVTLPNVTVTAKRKSDNAIITFSEDVASFDVLDFFGMGSSSNLCEYGCSSNGLQDLPEEVWNDEDYLYIINALNNNCLKQLFNQLKDGSLKDLLIAYTGSEHNLTVQNGSGLPSNVAGATGPGNDNNNIDMLLNENLLIGSTYEAATETILHEAIHAYFMGTYSSSSNDHVAMLCGYASSMIVKLQSTYSGLSYYDAASLVYSGFHANPDFSPQQLSTFNNAKTDFLNTIKLHEANTTNSTYTTDYYLEFTANNYRTGTVGTKFPVGGCQ